MTVWNDREFTTNLAHVTWMANIVVQIHHNERATGDPARNWVTSWAHRYFVGDNLRVLVLGCGEGWLERSLAEQPYIANIDACDFAEEAVERARELARAQGLGKIHYHVTDLNTAMLEENAYDVVVAHAVLHHIEKLEHAFGQIERAMRPNATFIINEYVGAKRFQYSEDVLRIINELLACLPEPLRRGAVERRVYDRRERPTVEQMIASDPTEAVRSDELLPFIESRFEVLDRRDIGGTILQHLLYDIAQNFRFDDPRERAYLELLCNIEAMLVDGGRIPADFVLLAARKKGAQGRYARPLPPRPEAATDTEPDPLGKYRRVRGARVVRFPLSVFRASLCAGRSTDNGQRKTENVAVNAHHLRALRIALLSTQPRRANLFHESQFWAFMERLRARRPAGEWLRRRYSAYGDDPTILALLDKTCTLAPHGG
ncbi:MAG TPA: class I SAM-dependent methyltransferase [Thermoanaerobaculia bacterium]